MGLDRRHLYKLELICIKYVPILMSLMNLINIILYYVGLGSELIDNIAGSSILTVVPMYISSYVYKFCKYHRMFINYILINNLLTLYDSIFGLPLSDVHVFVVYMGVAGISAFIILYLYLKYGDRQDK